LSVGHCATDGGSRAGRHFGRVVELLSTGSSFRLRGWAALVCVAAAWTGTSAATEPRNLLFDRLSLEQGLSQGTINAILQDRRGFMWFGTEDGLNRYDGYGFKVYKRDSNDPASLSHNFIWAIHEDKNGDLWIGTNGGGLEHWNRRTGRFTHHRHDPYDENTVGHDRVRAIHGAPGGVLWIGTDGGGLDRYDVASDTWTHYRHDPDVPTSLSSNRVRSILLDRDGRLWVGTYGGGLNRFDVATGGFEHYRHDPEDSHSLGGDRVYTVYEDRDGRLWIGTYGGGLSELDRESGRFKRYLHDPEDPDSIGAGRVRVVFQDGNDDLWVGTDGGLFTRRPGEAGFFGVRHRDTDPRSLSDDKITAIFEDRGRVLWVGTKSDGLNKRNTSTGSFVLIQRDPTASSTLSSNKVAAIQHDRRSDELWIGTFGGGLNRLDRATGRFTHYRQDDAGGLNDDRVMSLLLDRQGKLWIGTYEGGLNRLDPATGRFTHYRHDPDRPDSIGGNGVMSIHEDRRGRIWAGTFEGGLNRLDRSSGKFTRFVHDPSDSTTIASNTVTCFLEDRSGTLWVGTDGGGLNRFDEETGRFVRYRHDPEDPSSLSNDVVWSIHEDARRTLWIGTQGGGLNRWDPEDRRRDRPVFHHYTERNGLPNNLVYGILSDGAGRLWLSTNSGLSRFDPQAGTFKNYDTSYGLQSNEFNFGAYHGSEAGEMFFGGIKGLNTFFPAEVRDNSHVPPVVLTSFLKLNEEAKLDRPIYEAEKIILEHRDDVVSFEFAALDFESPEKNRYAYKLEGFDENWIQLGTTRRATYTNLDAGDYVLRVRGSNNDGVWNENAVGLEVSVLPPPWKSWWAYTIYGLILVGIVMSYTRAQKKKLEREAEYSRRLEHEVEARTQELATRNDELKDANRKLKDASLTDSLTGLRNRRYLMTEIDRSISLTERYYRMGQAERRGRSPAEADFLFLMIDLDGLKGINDTYGHTGGDLALLQMRDILRRSCRKSDTIIRWGGDEFLVVGRNMNLKSCESLAERIRESVAEHEFDIGQDAKVRLSCSIGFAHYPFLPWAPTLTPWEHVVAIADRALYLAKSNGRNAWVAIFGTERTPTSNLVRVFDEKAELLASEGAIELRSSLPDKDRLIWARAS
jgi:diguanylate cyclase (GGDEF)-like protein